MQHKYVNFLKDLSLLWFINDNMIHCQAKYACLTAGNCVVFKTKGTSDHLYILYCIKCSYERAQNITLLVSCRNFRGNNIVSSTLITVLIAFHYTNHQKRINALYHNMQYDWLLQASDHEVWSWWWQPCRRRYLGYL